MKERERERGILSLLHRVREKKRGRKQKKQKQKTDEERWWWWWWYGRGSVVRRPRETAVERARNCGARSCHSLHARPSRLLARSPQWFPLLRYDLAEISLLSINTLPFSHILPPQQIRVDFTSDFSLLALPNALDLSFSRASRETASLNLRLFHINESMCSE